MVVVQCDTMGARDWFRNDEWDAEIEAAFFARLKRSRAAFHRAQYLRIQGSTLIATADRELIRAGARLTQQVLDQFPEEQGQIAACACAMGDAHEALGDHEQAIEWYRRAWAYERKWPNSITNARLELALLIVRLARRGDGEEALRAVGDVNSDSSESMFPVVAMQKALVRATVADWQGDRAKSKAFALQGLAAAALPKSPLQYHPNLGIVGSNHKDQVEVLKRLAV